MGSVVKSSFTRIKSDSDRGKILGHKQYLEWRPDGPEARSNSDRLPEKQGTSSEKEFELDDEGLGTAPKGQRRATPRKFFSATEDHVSSRSLDKEIRAMKKGDIMFRVMLSPGSEAVDPFGYARDVMSRLGQQKGQDLRWAGIMHDNTDHQHVHVMLFGKDEQGGLVSLRRDDMMRLRSYGDRYIERELGLEMTFNRTEEEFARGRGLNLSFGSDRGRFMDVLNVPADKVWEANQKIEPIISTLEWSIFDDEWRKFQVDYTGREPRAQLGSSSYHDLGRQSDYTQLGDNKAEKEFWENFGKENPDKQDIAEDKLGELKEGDDFLRELIEDRTKVVDSNLLLDGLSTELEQDAAALQALLSPFDNRQREPLEIGGDYGEIDGLLGFDPNTDSDAHSPLVERLEMESENDFFDKLLGTSKEERELKGDDLPIIFDAHGEIYPSSLPGSEDSKTDRSIETETDNTVVNQEDDWSGIEQPGDDQSDSDRRDDEDDITFDPSGMY